MEPQQTYNPEATEKLRNLSVSAIDQMIALVQQGADPNTILNEKYPSDKGDCFPLQAAIYENRMDLLLISLERGANPNTHYRNTTSVLMNAACREIPEAVRALLDYGADPKYKNKGEITVLAYAFRDDIRKSLTESKQKIV